jgi:AcrR family transcriptional regulator
MSVVSTAPRPLGLRERNKRDKLRRIKDAARALFVAKSFDDATMREIALRAGVGLGTIFLYAENKRDLLFLIINEELEEVTAKSEDAVDPAAPLIDNLLAVAKLHYKFFGQQPALSRLVLREMAFYDSGAQARPFQKTRERLINLFGKIIELAMAQKRVASLESPRFIGWTIFCIFQVELRRWLSDNDSNLRAGLKVLERALALFIGGIKTSRRASGTQRKA